MARRSRGRGGVALLVLAAVAVVAIVWGPSLWERYGDEVLPSGRCTVALGDREDTKTAEQTNNIAIIVAGSVRHGLPARAATIAVATAIQESSLRNIDYGDRDSVGLFQQRPSQGWGTVEQILDPYYATDAFYDALVKVDGWQDMEITDAAQAVQRSGFPHAYADHEEEGRLWASALTGHGGDVSCDLGGAEPTTARAFTERVSADFGAAQFEFAVVDIDPDSTSVTGTSTSESRLDAALQQWSVAVASVEGVRSSATGAHGWARDPDDGAAETPRDAGALVTLQTTTATPTP